MQTIDVVAGDPVKGAEGYVADESGTFELLDFVKCRRDADPEGSQTCAFLAMTVAGITDIGQ